MRLSAGSVAAGPSVLKQWFGTVHDAIKEHGIHEDDIWNFDETGQGQIGRRITQGATYSFDMPRTLSQIGVGVLSLAPEVLHEDPAEETPANA